MQDLFNEEQEVPYFINGDEWMSYDDVESVRIKVSKRKKTPNGAKKDAQDCVKLHGEDRHFWVEN